MYLYGVIIYLSWIELILLFLIKEIDMAKSESYKEVKGMKLTDEEMDQVAGGGTTDQHLSSKNHEYGIFFQ